jgi:hypothetical protein
MSDTMIKSAMGIKEQLVRYYLRYHHKELSQIRGDEQFTLFDKIPENEKVLLLKHMDLNQWELPVLVTTVRSDCWIINTTERFWHISSEQVEWIAYQNFERHSGPDMKTARINPKVEGSIMPFGLQTTKGEIVYWDIPTGKTMFGFWNVTKKCEFVGRKYAIKEYQ